MFISTTPFQTTKTSWKLCLNYICGFHCPPRIICENLLCKERPGLQRKSPIHRGRWLLRLTCLTKSRLFFLAEESGIYCRSSLYCFSLKIIAVVLLKVIISFKYSDQVYFINYIYVITSVFDVAWMRLSGNLKLS